MGRGRKRRTTTGAAEAAAPTAVRPAPAARDPVAPGRPVAPGGPVASALPPDGLARWLPRWLGPPVDAKPWPIGWFLLALLAIWVLGTIARMGWLISFGWDAEAVQWQGTPFLTSSDGYYFAAGVQAALAGDAHGRTRIPEPGDHALVGIGFVVGKLFGLSADTVGLYLPALIGPAIAAPLAAIGRMVGRSGVGLVAALAVVVAPGYFIRTTAGYFDTDMFAVTIPLVAIACFVSMAVRSDAGREPGLGGIVGAGVLAAYPWFYDQGHPVGLAVALTAIAWLVVFKRREAWAWHLVAALGLSQADVAWTVLVPIVLGTPSALRVISSVFLTKLAERPARAIAIALPIVVALVGLSQSEAWSAAMAKLQLFGGGARMGEVQVPSADDATPDEGPADAIFKDTTAFVAEAQRLPLSELARRTLGNMPIALLGLAGLVLLALRERALLLVAPVLGLGLFSVFGGLRFTIYLSPVAGLGAGWVVSLLGGLVPRRWLRVVVTAALGLAVAAPGVDFVLDARPRPSIVRPEVEALDALRARTQPGDVVVSWWDYGYAVGHFARARTVVDGGRRHADTNLVAEMLLGTSQRAAANLARITVDAMDRRGGAVARRVFREAQRDRGLGAADFLASLDRPDAVVPRPARDIYLYLPARMMAILPAIDQVRPGESGHARPPLRGARPVLAKAEGERLVLPGGVIVDGKSMTVRGPRGERKLKRIFSIAGGGGKPIDVKRREGDPAAPTSGVFIRRTGLYAEMDDRLLASVFVQLFAFEQADPEHFELVFANEAAKIYRIR
ncbi:MAG: hypothetical protein IT385_14415 [Deltaproteobacteria bacterium]|nr:hypothetical protein [Deltaproteobacteria bacterium]